MRGAVIAALLGAALPAPAGARAPVHAQAASTSLASALALVRTLYTSPAPDASREAVQRLYVPDLAALLLKAMDPASPEGLPFDMRYGDQNWKIQGLSFAAARTSGGATVTVRFKSFGAATRIDWRLVRAAQGWRIYDVQGSPVGANPAWSLRELLRLSARRSS